MDIEFHYYMTYLIALKAGFRREDAYTIAYSSQFTDDNDYPYRIEGKDGFYRNLISQTVDITKPQEERLSIYPVFHFCPGALSETLRQAPPRKDSKYHPLNTIAGGVNARKIFDDAVNSRDPYRIGIGTHMYADTFCHRDFVGYKDEFNWIKIEGLIKGLLDDILPCIGHALALYHPDIPSLVWEDTRLMSPGREKRNKEQILSATGDVFDILCGITKPRNANTIKSRLLGDLGMAIGEEADSDSSALVDARIQNYKALLGADYREYDKDEWFDEAVRQEADPHAIGTADIKYNYFWKGAYRDSNWYAFQEAAKVHKSKALAVLGGNFAATGINVAGNW